MAPRDPSSTLTTTTTTTTSSIPPSRSISGPVVPSQDHSEDRTSSSRGVATATDSFSVLSNLLRHQHQHQPLSSTPPQQPQQQHQPLLDSDKDSKDSNMLTQSMTTGLARNTNTTKRRIGDRRVVFWALGAMVVCLIVVIILVEDEALLRRADKSVEHMSWKRLPENKMNNHKDYKDISPLTVNSDRDRDSTDTISTSATGSSIVSKKNSQQTSIEAKGPLNDDIFSLWFGQRKEQSDNEVVGYKTKNIVKKKLQPFPVVQYDDDNIPQAVAGSILHASDALLCRDSVIDYVINATDLKDECDGLKRAFTKNCADQEDDEEPVLTSRRRLLWTTTTTTTTAAQRVKLENPVERLQRKLYYISRTFHSWWYAPSDNSLFMAEDKILEVWDDTAFEVERGWDMLYRAEDIEAILRPVNSALHTACDSDRVTNGDMTVFRSLEEQEGEDENPKPTSATSPGDKEKENNDKVTQGSGDNEEEEEEEEADDQKTKVKPSKKDSNDVQNKTVPSKDGNKHMANLALPITNKHVSDKVITETLMLQQDQKIIKAVQNQTNHTIAQADAAASQKAVSDAADIVSSVLNDPTSVEARTCCTSILNVFHENCSVDDEEELSDVRLFVSVVVIACCGLIKSLIRHFSIRWLPEAAGCILVGGTYVHNFVVGKLCFSFLASVSVLFFFQSMRILTLLFGWILYFIVFFF
jgi:hypothetical protein